jgi:chromate transporter
VLLSSTFFALKPAVLAIVLEAVVRLRRNALRSQFNVGLAALAFVGILALRIPARSGRQ